MAELKPGEKSYDKTFEPIRKAGFCTYWGMMRFLKIPHGSHSHLDAHMKALGIVLEPFRRDDGFVTKQYKKHRRPFTEDEAKRIIERHRALQGRDEED